MPRKPLVYIAGPITKPDVYANTNRGVRIYLDMLEDGIVTPFCPHLSVYAQILDGREGSYDFWLGHDFEVISHCAALYRMPGVSEGADAEVTFANENDIPVFTSVQELYEATRSGALDVC